MPRKTTKNYDSRISGKFSYCPIIRQLSNPRVKFFERSCSSSYSQLSKRKTKDFRRKKKKREKQQQPISHPTHIMTTATKRLLDDPIQERPKKFIKRKRDIVSAEIQNINMSPSVKETEALSVKSVASQFPMAANESHENPCKIASYVSKIRQHRLHSHLIKSSWVGMPSSAQKGIYNPAVLCYRNSLLQALLHAPKVVNWLRSYHSSKLCVRDGVLCVACHLLSVFNCYWGSTPKELLQATKELDRVFVSTGWQDGRTGRQEDPEEQLVWLAKVLSQQLPSIQFDGFEAISRFILNSSTKCSSCAYVSVNKGEVEGTISIDLQPRIRNGTIADYLKPYFSHRVEGFKCAKCSSKSPKKRIREIYYQPETLVIQLKRFGWDGRKDSTPIAFSPTLSLDHYRSDFNSYSCEYDLSAVICHNGGINSGHYVCRARGPDGKWMKFDDLKVSGITPDQAMHPGSKNGFTPYLLFYQRQNQVLTKI